MEAATGPSVPASEPQQAAANAEVTHEKASPGPSSSAGAEAASDGGAAGGGSGTAAAPLSKRQQKKAAKREQLQEQKLRVKAETKAKKAAAVAARRAAVQEALQAMTPEEIEARDRTRQERQEASRQEREEKRSRLAAAMQGGPAIAIDLDFDTYMNEGEHRSLCQQLMYCYSANVKAPSPVHLLFLGAQGGLKAQMERQISGMENWQATRSDAPYIEHFAGRRGDLVYLTADSPHTLTTLDPSKVYIIGGLVDRNRHKGICKSRADAQGIATAALPIAEHVQMESSRVITVNQVVDILLGVHATGDWAVTLRRVIPQRKTKQPAADGATAGGVEAAAPNASAGSSAADGSAGGATDAAAAAQP